MRTLGRVAALGVILLAAACVPKPRSDAPPPLPPRQEPAPAPAPAPAAPPVQDWGDLPLTPGAWTYAGEPSGSRASYGPAQGEAQFVLRCERAGRRILISRAGTDRPLTLRTSYGARTVALVPQAGSPAHAAASLSASDALFDQIAFSRGRFTVDAPGAPRLVLPAWPETARVVEDCRA